MRQPQATDLFLENWLVLYRYKHFICCNSWLHKEKKLYLYGVLIIIYKSQFFVKDIILFKSHIALQYDTALSYCSVSLIKAISYFKLRQFLRLSLMQQYTAQSLLVVFDQSLQSVRRMQFSLRNNQYQQKELLCCNCGTNIVRQWDSSPLHVTHQDKTNQIKQTKNHQLSTIKS